MGQMGRPVRKDPAKLKQAAQMLNDGASYKDVLQTAGYSASVAKQGKAGVPDVLKNMAAEMLLAQGKELAAIGKQLDPQHVERAISGKLYSAMLTGDESGCSAAKLLGTMRKHNLFQADSMTGVIVLAAPNITPAGKPLNAVDEADILDGDVVEPKRLTE